MLQDGIIHGELLGHLARLRHTDWFAVSDAGLPVPRSVPVVDLGFVYGEPAFTVVLPVILRAIVVEGGMVADELAGRNPRIAEFLARLLPVQPDEIPHEVLKQQVAGCAFVVRTGEATPYSNVLLRSGVPF